MQNQYNKIEKQKSINVNVFGYEDRQPFPIYISKESNKDMLIFLLITEDKNQHYISIIYISRNSTDSCSIKIRTQMGNTSACTASSNLSRREC